MPTSAAELRRLRAGAYENPRPEVQELVPHGARRILDLGCSSGALGAALKARQGAAVVGVELDPAYARDAGGRLDRVITADLETIDLGSQDLGTIDCVIAADVLEHLRDPWGLLRRAVAVLAPGGTAVVSLPNVRYWETLATLALRGTWPRRDQGIFDRDHLRWFTLADARALLEQAGLSVTEVSPRYRLKPDDWRSEAPGRRFARTPLSPFFVFQYVLAAVKTPA
ncbi:MAG TPA: class I SAM-dependent methyltransferase [Solirubrobacteraceae bacterium]|nr:class I SAM-dependent methyltransferase [Solirubrobacteraceae bacterium]